MFFLRLVPVFVIEPFACLRSDPDFAAFVNFLFPDRDDALDLFDGEAARGERSLAMGRGHGNDEAGFGYLNRTEPVNNGDTADRPALSGLFPDPREFFFRHL